MTRTRRTFLTFGSVYGIYTLMVIGSHWIPVLWWLVIPVWFPLVFLLGDEWEPTWGYWGARAWSLFGPIPYLLLGSWILALLFHRAPDRNDSRA